MLLEVAVHAGGEAFVVVARLRLELRVGGDGALAAAEGLEVGVERAAAVKERGFTAGSPQARRGGLTVVLALQPAHGVAGGAHRNGAHVRHAVFGAKDFHFRPGFGRAGEGCDDEEDGAGDAAAEGAVHHREERADHRGAGGTAAGRSVDLRSFGTGRAAAAATSRPSTSTALSSWVSRPWADSPG